MDEKVREVMWRSSLLAKYLNFKREEKERGSGVEGQVIGQIFEL